MARRMRALKVLVFVEWGDTCGSDGGVPEFRSQIPAPFIIPIETFPEGGLQG